MKIIKNRLDALNALLDANGGHAEVELRVLRDMVGCEKLGRCVLAFADDVLQGEGIRHFPEEWPNNPRWKHTVIIYRKNSFYGELLSAIHPGSWKKKFINSLDTLYSEHKKTRRVRRRNNVHTPSGKTYADCDLTKN